MKRSLLIGCGHSRAKKVSLLGEPDWAGELTTLDISPDVGADVIHDMENLPLPFPDETFDEIGHFDTLEHWGRQGDFRGWFAEAEEYWRILKPRGRWFVLVPLGGDAFADPGHTRFFHQNHFGFLMQKFYEDNQAKGTPFTDYRWLWKKNFDVLAVDDSSGHHLSVVLEKA